jgi:DNA-binding CsgD family transcriptional regulator
MPARHSGSLARPGRKGPPPGGRPDLSRRQCEVLELLADGVPAREIARRLGLAEPTVRNHIRLVLRKLDCHSQLEAVAVAYRIDLLRRETPAGPAVSVPAGPTL